MDSSHDRRDDRDIVLTDQSGPVQEGEEKTGKGGRARTFGKKI